MKNNKKFFQIGWRKAKSRTQVGMFLQTKRLEIKASQEQIAKKCKINIACYRGYEQGKFYPNLEVAKKISEALFCSCEELKALIPRKGKIPTTEIGKFIMNRREELGLNLMTFAKRLGVSKERARCMELSTSKLSYKTLSALNKALELEGHSLIMSEEIKRSKLGQIIMNRRLELGITIRELASRMGITYQAVSLVETGKTKLLDDNALNKFSQALNINVEVLKLARSRRNINRRYVRKINLAETRPASLGKFITKKRLDMGLAQGHLAKLAKVSQGTIVRIERDSSCLKIKTLLKILQSLGCETSKCKIKFIINKDEFEIAL